MTRLPPQKTWPRFTLYPVTGATAPIVMAFANKDDSVKAYHTIAREICRDSCDDDSMVHLAWNKEFDICQSGQAFNYDDGVKCPEGASLRCVTLATPSDNATDVVEK